MTDANTPNAPHPERELLLYAYDEASTTERTAVDAHIAHCATCRALLATMMRVRKAGESQEASPQDAGIWTRALDNVAQRRQQARWTPMRTAQIAAPLAIAAALTWFVLLPKHDRTEYGNDTATTVTAAPNVHRASVVRFGDILRDAPLVASHPDVMARFVSALRQDASPNVRLAVVDALRDAPASSLSGIDVGQVLLAEPLSSIRLALIDLVVQNGDARSRRAITQLAQTDPDASVRARAQVAELQLTEERPRARE